MRTSLKVIAIGLAGGLTVAGVAAGLAASAGAENGERPDAVVLHAALAPSQPTYSSIFGTVPGALPWSMQAGHVRLGQDGSLEVNVAGLVVTTTGTNPISDLAASVYCDGTLAATTAAVPLSTNGNAHLHATVLLPKPCLVPAVVLNPAPGGTVATTTYIAYDGTNPLAAPGLLEQRQQRQSGNSQGQNGQKHGDHDGGQ